MHIHNQTGSQESEKCNTKDIIIYLGELLVGAKERTRFIDIENRNPSFSKKIDAYQRRVQSGIWNLTSKDFSPVFDIIFNITHTILDTRNEPIFPREELVKKIAYLSLFECQYLINAINSAIYPETQTILVVRTAYLHLIRAFLQERIEAIKKVRET